MMRLSIKEIYQTYAKYHKGKAKSVNAQKYSVGLLDNIFNTQLALQPNSYTPKPYTCFVATNGTKPRKILAADFSDRVINNFYQQLKKWHTQYTKTAVQGKLFILNKDNTTQINRLLASYLGQLQTQAQSYVFVSEQGYIHNRLKQRQPRQLFLSNHLGGLYV